MVTVHTPSLERNARDQQGDAVPSKAVGQKMIGNLGYDGPVLPLPPGFAAALFITAVRRARGGHVIRQILMSARVTWSASVGDRRV